jgi:hypothetical protein
VLIVRAHLGLLHIKCRFGSGLSRRWFKVHAGRNIGGDQLYVDSLILLGGSENSDVLIVVTLFNWVPSCNYNVI